MTGWFVFALLALAAGGLALRLGVPRALASFLGAALALGAAGYALQGRPGLPGMPVTAAATAGEVDPGLSALRLRMFGRFTRAEPYLAGADALTRAGATGSAVRLLLGGVNAAPADFALWTALGGAYADHDGNSVSPAARLSFDRAMQLAPDHPGPPFFLGVAHVRAGEFRQARDWWALAYRLTPATSSYRPEIGARLELLDRLLASEAGQGLH